MPIRPIRGCIIFEIEVEARAGNTGRTRMSFKLLYHFDRKFMVFETLVSEMADKFSFEFWRF
jgi:hypothetical protein